MMIKLIWRLIGIYQKLPKNILLGIPQKLFVKYNLYKFLNKKEIVVATRNGITYELDLRELMDSLIYYTGCHEPQTKAVIDKYCKPEMTIFDIGANSGEHTFQFAKLTGKNGKVIAFEPMPWAFSKLERNMKLNDLNNILLEKLALSDVSEKKSINFKASWPLSRITQQQGPAEKINEVEFITLDEYVRKEKIAQIDFIKLDVDGYEYRVIMGGYKSIAKFKPIMIIEFFKQAQAKLENLADLLISLDYYLCSQKNFKKYKDKKTLLSSIPNDDSTNILCIPKKQDDAYRGGES